MSSSNFIEKHNGVVLKLRLPSTNGAHQIRRIKLDRISDGRHVSYRKLSAVAVKFAFPDSPFPPSQYDVNLTYYDEDNDCVTIASTDELADAIEQYSSRDPPALRITADVKLKKGAKAPKDDEKAKEAPAQEEPAPEQPQEQPTTGEIPSASSSTRSRPPVAQVKHIAKSVLDILATSLDNIQTNLEQKDGGPVPPFVPPSEASAPSENTRAPMEGQDESTERKEEQFIHGRHTCDGCLRTPIIGLRFHAKNLQDYDLCENCMGNYKGSEIEFEPAQLDRDVPFQTRWRRQQNRQHNRDHARQRRRQHRGPRGAPRGPPHGCGGRGQFHRMQHHNLQMESALKMALERSLRDINSNESKEIEPEVPPAKEKEEIESAPENAPAKAPINDPVVVEDVDPESETEATVDDDEATVNDDEEVSVAETKTSKETVDATSEVEIKVEAEVPITEPKDEIEDAVSQGSSIGHTPSFKKESGDFVSPKQTVRIPSSGAKSVSSNLSGSEQSFLSAAAGNGHVAEAIGEALDRCANAIDAMVSELEKEPTLSVANSSKSADDDDNESQVENNEEPQPTTIIDAVESTEGGTNEEWEVVGNENQEPNDEMLARAAQLLGSALFEQDVADSGVVEPSAPSMEDITKDDNNGNNNLAASQNSSSSSGSGSSSSSSVTMTTTFSGFSSVPSHIPSITSHTTTMAIPAPVLARWDAHLKQLHELGFLDDRKSVEILEMLQASQIGVDSDEEVTVAEVVNALLNQ